MSKKCLLMVLLCATLCSPTMLRAQRRYVMTPEQLFALADQRSATIRAGEAAVREADEAVREARNGRLPEVELSLSASYLGDGCLSDRDFDHGMHVDMPHFGNNFAIEASQLIYGGGAVTQTIALSKLGREMAAVGLEQSRSRLRMLLIGFYLDLFKLENLLKIYDRNMDLAKQVLEHTRARHEAGVALSNDITRYELQLHQIALARTRVENSIEILNYDLCTTLGLEADGHIVPDSALLSRALPHKGADHWRTEALEHAHDLRYHDLQIEINQRKERLARADRLPKVALIAANHFDGPITIEVPVIDKNFNYWFVGVGVSFRLSSLYKSGKSIRRAQYATTTSRLQREESEERTLRTITSDHIRYMEACREVETLEKSVELARSNYQIVENRYQNDMVLVTDLIDAANEQLSTELQLANARINVLFKYYQLKHTSGIL